VSEDDTASAPDRLGWLLGLGTIAASAAALIWIGWLAWHAIDHRDVTDLLILAAIFIALPAWHMVTRALEREKRADLGLYVSDAWLRQCERFKARAR